MGQLSLPLPTPSLRGQEVVFQGEKLQPGLNSDKLKVVGIVDLCFPMEILKFDFVALRSWQKKLEKIKKRHFLKRKAKRTITCFLRQTKENMVQTKQKKISNFWKRLVFLRVLFDEVPSIMCVCVGRLIWGNLSSFHVKKTLPENTKSNRQKKCLKNPKKNPKKNLSVWCDVWKKKSKTSLAKNLY